MPICRNIICLLLLFQLKLICQIDSARIYINELKYSQSEKFLLKNQKKNYKTSNLSKAVDLYNLACIYSITKKYSKCIEYLKKCNALDSNVFMPFYTDCDFYNISKTIEWKHLLFEYKKHKNIHIEDSLFFDISKIAIQDQLYHREIEYYERMEGISSSNVKKLWHKKDSLNNENLTKIEEYMNKNVNVLSNTVVGERRATCCFLVIQHSDVKTREKYLPILKNLYEKNETAGENYALLYDRVSIYKNEGKQFYGTQINQITRLPFPIINEKDVDKRRNEFGMMPIKEYLLGFGINYSPKQ